MKRKRHNQRLFIALAAALFLIATVPLMAAFAGGNSAMVSESDISRSDVPAVIEHHLSADPKPALNDPADSLYNNNNPEFWFSSLAFYTESLGKSYYYYNDANCVYLGYDSATDEISFIAPDCSNPKNTFLYWRDTQNGKIYYPGQTYSVKMAEIKRKCIIDDNSSTVWYIKANWEGDELEFEMTAFLQFDIPSDSEDAWTWDDYNKYEVWEDKNVETSIIGIYNLRTKETVYEGNYSLRIPDDYIPTYKEYSFAEWNTKPNGDGTSYHPGDSVPLTDENSFILYAIFDGYTTKHLLYISWYDWTTENYDNYAVPCDENGIVPELRLPAAPAKASGTFAGWRNTDKDELMQADRVYNNFDASANCEFDDYYESYRLSLEAEWEGDKVAFNRCFHFNLIFNDGENSYDPVVSGFYNMNSGKITYDGDPTFAIPDDATPDNPDGFDFLGWNTSEYGNGIMYQPGVPMHLKDLEGIDRYFYYVLFATFRTDSEFEIVVEDHDVSNIVQKVEPSAGLVLADDVSFDEVKMVVANVEGQVREEVINAVSEWIDVRTEGDDVNIQMLDIYLVDSQDRGVSVSSGKILILIAYPDIPNAKDYNYVIYHYKDGFVEQINVEKLDDCLAFYADSFSPYALVWVDETQDNPDDPDNPDDHQNPVEFIATDEDGKHYSKDQIKINIIPIAAENAADYIRMTGENANQAQAYDIYITAEDGTSLTLIDGKSLTVELPRPNVTGSFSFRLYHIVNGQAVPVKLSKQSGVKLVYEANGFSPYVLTWHEIKSTGSDSPATGDNFTPNLFVILLVISAAALISAIMYIKGTKRVKSEA